MKTMLVFALLFVTSCSALDAGVLRKKEKVVAHESFVKALTFQHRLRACNAYPYAAALDVFRGKKEKLTSTSPMAYQSCQDFDATLKDGDQLEFKVGDANAGTFSVSDLPKNDATLLLVIYRHDPRSTAVAFESHVFANLENAQLAVLDTYKGPEKSKLTIRDSRGAKTTRSEELRYDSVVAVNQGKYECALLSKDGKEVTKKDLIALNSESYVVIRSGIEAEEGPSFPQDLMIYPQSDVNELGAAAGLRTSLALLFLTMAFAFDMQR